MMPDNNPFLEGYIASIRGKRNDCPYVEDTAEYERWCQGAGGKPEVKLASVTVKPATTPVAEGRRPFVEGYKSHILASRFGKKDACPYEEGTPEYERWIKGYRGQPTVKRMGWEVKKPIVIPVAEGRRPFVEGYKSQILASRFGAKKACPYEEGTREFERWSNGFAWWATTKAQNMQTTHR